MWRPLTTPHVAIPISGVLIEYLRLRLEGFKLMVDGSRGRALELLQSSFPRFMRLVKRLVSPNLFGRARSLEG